MFNPHIKKAKKKTENINTIIRKNLNSTSLTKKQNQINNRIKQKKLRNKIKQLLKRDEKEKINERIGKIFAECNEKNYNNIYKRITATTKTKNQAQQFTYT